MNQKEKLFFDQLKDIFIGMKIEGESGFINLMRIKSAYFDVIFKELNKEIKEKTKDFPDFREEMFDKLYTFFKTYFSESGSIYFNYTPLKSKVYEKIYSPNKDVILFWKTRMLYYVKTDKLWNNLTIDFDEDSVRYKINFDVSKLQHKKANEKREIIYELKEIKDREITFNVLYSERGRKTKIDEILRAFKKKNIHLDEERLLKLFRTYEKQNEVDYFINKNAEQFLKEQFDLWLKNYLFDDESDFSEKRLKQLKVLKEIAYKVIDFVAQFEDELVKIWNKPKFVLNSNYVITLNKIAKKDGGIEFIEKILKRKGFKEQKEDWKELGILDAFDEGKLFINTPNGKGLNKEYQFLPIDTKYFDEDTKLELLSLFDDLDKELDGWLIHSENYQALKTILSKFKEKVQTIYIDPPFKTGKDFFYKDKFQDSTWLTLMENRLNLARDFLHKEGSIFVHLDWNANFLGRYLLGNLFSEITEIIWNTNATKDEEAGLFQYKSFGEKYVRQHDTIFQCAKTRDYKFIKLWKPNRRTTNLPIGWLDLISYPHIPNPQKLEDYEFYVEKWNEDGIFEHQNLQIDEKIFPIGDIWNDIYSFTQSELRVSENVSFDTQKPENLLRRIIQSTSKKGDIVMDFFAGSGTTLTVAHKLKRKWIGVEVAQCFNEFYFDEKEKKLGLLGRMKIVLAGDKEFIAINKNRRSHLSKDINWQGGGFFKYYELEQYEQTLKKAVYKPSHPFVDFDDKSIYQQYVFMKDLKLLDAMKLDYENNKVRINFDEIYPNIDLAETLSNLTGKAIKKVEKNAVIFEDGSKIDFDNVDFNLIKPLIWW